MTQSEIAARPYRPRRSESAFGVRLNRVGVLSWQALKKPATAVDSPSSLR